MLHGQTFETVSADVIDKSTQLQPETSYVPRKVLGVTLVTRASGEDETTGHSRSGKAMMGFGLCFKGVTGLEGGRRKGSEKTGCGGAVEESWLRRQEKINTSRGSQGWGLEEGHPGSRWRRLSEWLRWQQ